MLSLSLIHILFSGNINPNEKQFDRNSAYGKAAAGLVDEEEKLRSTLDQEASSVLNKDVYKRQAQNRLVPSKSTRTPRPTATMPLSAETPNTSPLP